MRFNPRARVDGSQIEQRSGGGGGGGGGAAGGIAGLLIALLGRKGGIWAIVAVVAAAIIVPMLNGGGGGGGGTTSQGGACTGAQANDDRDCRLAFITASVQDYWASAFPEETGRKYVEIKTVSFSGSVTTDGCGSASSDVGPFYCPNDQRVYLDLTFFDTLLKQLGGKDTAFTEAYVVAHEYGHHIENLMGVMGQVRTQQGPNSDAVKLETMADCLAGVWAKGATTTKDADGQVLISDLTDADIREGIAAAKVVGDDQIQQRTQGRVDQEGWTHGSSAQRIAAFNVGLEQGTIKACNFFDASNPNYPES